MDTLPLSGEILGALARAAGLTSDELGVRAGLAGSQVRAYLAGSRIGDAARVRVLEAASKVFTEMAADAQCAPTSSDGMALLPKVLVALADNWDRTVTTWRVYSFAPDLQRAAGAAALRLAALDFGFRIAAAARLMGAKAPAGIPLCLRWSVVPGGKGRLLHALVVQSGFTRDELTERVGTISDSALDRYLSGASSQEARGADRPSDVHLASLAAALAPRIQGASTRGLAATLRLHYTVTELAELVARVVGWRLLDEAVAVFLGAWRAGDSRLAARTSDAIHALLSGAGEADALGVSLIALPQGPRWAEAALACRTNWFGYLMYEARRVERRGDAPFDAQVPPANAMDWALRGWFALALVDDATAIACFRRAVALAPADPELHMDLSCALDGALVDDGANGERERLLEALAEVRIALGLRPGWPEARRTEAMLLDALGDSASARAILEELSRMAGGDAEASMGQYQLAVSHYEAGRLRTALGALKSVLRDYPDHADALALAARCEEALGNRASADARASQASALGLLMPRRQRKPTP